MITPAVAGGSPVDAPGATTTTGSAAQPGAAAAAAAAAEEEARVASLTGLGVLDQPPAEDFEAIARLALFVSGAGSATVTFLDEHREFPAAAVGTERDELPREVSMCVPVVTTGGAVHVADASRDPRFADNPAVDGRLSRTRMYVGLPVHDREGRVLGALTVQDPRVRALDEGQLAALTDLAAQVDHLLEMRRQQLEVLDVLAEVDHLAHHDALTGLVNRRVLVDRLSQALLHAERSGRAPTVFFCDLDGFKAVNDALGHDAGDAALVDVARGLVRVVRPQDTVSRLGGDEFVVVCEDLAPEDREDLAARLRTAVLAAPAPGTAAVPGAGAGGEIGAAPWAALTLSVGVLVAEVGQAPAAVLRSADARMYAEKQARRARHRRPAPPVRTLLPLP